MCIYIDLRFGFVKKKHSSIWRDDSGAFGLLHECTSVPFLSLSLSRANYSSSEPTFWQVTVTDASAHQPVRQRRRGESEEKIFTSSSSVIVDPARRKVLCGIRWWRFVAILARGRIGNIVLYIIIFYNNRIYIIILLFIIISLLVFGRSVQRIFVVFCCVIGFTAVYHDNNNK